MTARLITEKDLKPRVDVLLRTIHEVVPSVCDVQYQESAGGDIVAELVWPGVSDKRSGMRIVVYTDGFEVIPADPNAEKFWCYHSEHVALARASDAAHKYIS